MNLLCRFSLPSTVVSLCLLTTALAQGTSGEKENRTAEGPSRADTAALQKKASAAQARIHRNQEDRDQLIRAIKINEVILAKQVLLKNGFTDKDLENAKITLRTGGGKGGEDEIKIFVTCCDPKEITIQRSLEYFTK